MSWYSYSDAKYERSRIQAKLAKSGKHTQLQMPAKGIKIAHSFWGKAWCKNLEAYHDYASRLPRGRSYLRAGCVYDLSIATGEITAMVVGSYEYDVRIVIERLNPRAWKQLCEDCAGQVGSLLDLLGGKLGDDVLRAVTHPEKGLFPKPREIRLICSCPDSANMCKHVAAVLYGVGVLLDKSPELFFVLRSVDPADLLSKATESGLAGASVDAALAGEDLSALFGIDLDAGTLQIGVPEEPKVSEGSKGKMPTKKTARRAAGKAKTEPKKTTAAKRKSAGRNN